MRDGKPCREWEGMECWPSTEAGQPAGYANRPALSRRVVGASGRPYGQAVAGQQLGL